MQKQNSFYVTVFTNGSRDYYPENSLSKFTVKLRHALVTENNENWQVGLHSASYTNIEKQPPEEIVIKIPATAESFENSQVTLISMIYNIKEFYNKVKNPDFLNNS